VVHADDLRGGDYPGVFPMSGEVERVDATAGTAIQEGRPELFAKAGGTLGPADQGAGVHNRWGCTRGTGGHGPLDGGPATPVDGIQQFAQQAFGEGNIVSERIADTSRRWAQACRR
jgi:hypothetical protein